MVNFNLWLSYLQHTIPSNYLIPIFLYCKTGKTLNYSFC
ncbi:hypothetical protein KIS1582_0104 [Cytobacillus firmus]|uniref:Uncharacterized protein n=1 Tax=Cytobacillus firmus TaxID=1399 RepID=A0A800NGB0_CYTFI|nr:hypothetical protein KIS1582_0104 [Cytobacillus firmus]